MTREPVAKSSEIALMLDGDLISRKEATQTMSGSGDMYSYCSVCLAHASHATYIAKLANLHLSVEANAGSARQCMAIRFGLNAIVWDAAIGSASVIDLVFGASLLAYEDLGR